MKENRKITVVNLLLTTSDVGEETSLNVLRTIVFTFKLVSKSS